MNKNLKKQKKNKKQVQKQHETETQRSKNIQNQAQKPEWNSTLKDDSQYKLTPSEIFQKKISMMSKHKLEAKEQWSQIQEKLQNGVIDEQTSKIYNTAKESKNLNKIQSDRIRKNLSQMLDYNKLQNSNVRTDYLDDQSDINSQQSNRCSSKQKKQEEGHEKQQLHHQYDTCHSQEFSSSLQNINEQCENEEDDKDFLKQIEYNLFKTRDFISKMEGCACSNHPEHVLKVLQNEEKNSKKNDFKKFSKNQSKLSSFGRTTATINSNKSQVSNSNRIKTTQDSNQPQDHLKQEDMELVEYFKSLNKIEDTIKFMESQILGKGEEDKNKTTKQREIQKITEEDVKIEKSSKQTQLFNNDDNHNLDQLNLQDQKLDRNYYYNISASEQLENKLEKSQHVTNNTRGSFQKLRHSQKNQTENDNNDQISFSLTNRSSDMSPEHGTNDNKNIETSGSKQKGMEGTLQEQDFKKKQKNSNFQEFHKNNEYQEKDDSKGLGRHPHTSHLTQNQIHQDQKTNTIQIQNQQQQQQRNIFEQQFPQINNISMTLKNVCGPNQSQQPYDDDNDIDSIRKMLENTKKDLEKLNCKTVFDFPHNVITLNTKTNYNQTASSTQQPDFLNFQSQNNLVQNDNVFSSINQANKVNNTQFAELKLNSNIFPQAKKVSNEIDSKTLNTSNKENINNQNFQEFNFKSNNYQNKIQNKEFTEFVNTNFQEIPDYSNYDDELVPRNLNIIQQQKNVFQ